MIGAHRTIGGVVLALVVALLGSVVLTAPAGAAAPHPCKLFTRPELAGVLGAAVGPARIGFDTSSSSQCEYRVAASGDRPAGTLVVHITTKNAKQAFQHLVGHPLVHVPVDGLADAFYTERTKVVRVLVGDVMLAVQGTFVSTEPLPVHAYDAQAQLVQLAKLAVGRVPAA